MVKFVCRCLNVTVNCASSASLGPEDVQRLGQLALADPFLNNSIVEVKLNSHGINLAQNALLATRQNGKLIFNRCLCCKQDTHAALGNNERVFVNSALQHDPDAIQALQESENYSPLYKLILPVIPDIPERSFQELKQQSKTCQLDTVIQPIRQQATNYLCEKQKEMDERIRVFTEQQYSEYKKLQQRALSERQLMIHLLFEVYSLDGVTPSVRFPLAGFPSPPTSPDNSENTPSSEYSFERTENPVPKALVKVATSQLTSNVSLNVRTSKSSTYHKMNDNSTMFDMDGLEEDTAPFPLSDDEADTDDSTTDDLGRIRQYVKRHQSCATSLPISVPLWSPGNPAELSDDSDKSSNPDPQEIAASIQALALSIRDDKDMFGDLPRRRLNTGDLVKSRPI